ncbi:MAG: carbohydrate ABC transporter permease, partial [Pseudomonadota bacterium]|nr:carbohydrate ABC transporter permease [Pseudomonadota bacterium]
MTAVWQFLSRRQGKGARLTLGDWLSYSYLVLGFLVIFLPVMWIVLNSFKSAFQLDKQDLSLLPTDFVRVARATVNDADGKTIFIMADLPDWVLNWKDLDEGERSGMDVDGLLQQYSGDAFYVLRSHLGQVDGLARQLVADRNLPEWLPRYSTLPAASKANFDVDAVLASVNPEEGRLLAEWMGIKPFKANKLISQILVTAPHPET